MGHGRQETRTYLALDDPPGLSGAADWEKLKAVIVGTRERQEGDKHSCEQHDSIGSAAAAPASSAKTADLGMWRCSAAGANG